MTISESKYTLLIVDDNATNVSMLGSVLSSEYKIKAALNGRDALSIAQSEPVPDLILLDVMMPEMDGFEVCRKLKEKAISAHIPVIFVTAMSAPEHEKEGLELGAVDYIHKPFSPAIVNARVKTQIALHETNQNLEKKVAERTKELVATKTEIIHRLARAAEFRDEETGNHIIRMSHYARSLAVALHQPNDWVSLIFTAAPMHDVGKIGVPDRILLKPGKLTADEWEIMKNHTVWGADILGDSHSDILALSREIALTHHEKWDGSGYPRGLKGDEIPLSGQIVAIADVFDALTSERPYKQPWQVDEAVAYITRQSGTHFSPELVDTFVSILPEILSIKEKFAD